MPSARPEALLLSDSPLEPLPPLFPPQAVSARAAKHINTKLSFFILVGFIILIMIRLLIEHLELSHRETTFIGICLEADVLEVGDHAVINGYGLALVAQIAGLA